MKCEEVRSLLSDFFDNELPEIRRNRISSHLESCTECANDLESYKNLSFSTERLENPEVPSEIWGKVEKQLRIENSPTPSKPQQRKYGRLFWWASVGAIIPLVIAIVYLGQHNHEHHDHEELAADFSEYLDAFGENPSEAHLVLVNKYQGKDVALEHCHIELGYRPTIGKGLPEGYTIQTSFVIDMPCCKCLKTICQRRDGSILAIFEHDDEQPIWFGDRSSTQDKCGGKSCVLTQLQDKIAVSWKQGTRHLTIIGAHDSSEAELLVEHLGSSQDASKT